jgi:hypothetical protein
MPCLVWPSMRRALALLAFLLPALAFAQARPFGECRTGYWSSNRNLDAQNGTASATCFVQWKPSVSDGLRFAFNARTGWQDSGSSSRESARLRDGYIEFESGPWTGRLGRQIIAWGRSDRVNPTDYLSPRDFTLLAPEDEDQRNGINAGLLKYHIDNALSLTAVVARFEAHRTPEGSLPPNRKQSDSQGQREWAVKLDHAGEGADWSVSYFDGFDRFSRYSVEYISPTQPIFLGAYEKVQALGADLATASGSWTFRGEFSYAQHQTSNSSRRKVTRAVIGADRDFWDTANINAQLFLVSRDHAVSVAGSAQLQQLGLAVSRLNSEFSRREWGLTVRLSNRFINDRLKLEISSISDLTNQSGVVRPRAVYALNDALRLSAGLDRFYGRRQSYFGSRSMNNVAFVELAFIY